jgi:hypothetical protein
MIILQMVKKSTVLPLKAIENTGLAQKMGVELYNKRVQFRWSGNFDK